MNITEHDYNKEVQNIAQCIVNDNKGDYEDTEGLEEAINDTLLHEAIDSHMWIIYYSYNLDVYEHSSNRDYAVDNFGDDWLQHEIKENGLAGLHQGLAFWCLYADVQEALSGILTEMNDATNGDTV